MIATTKKQFDEILRLLDGYGNVFVVGCGDCAAQCETGGDVEVEEMKQKLEEAGKTVTGTVVPDVTCNVPDTARLLRKQKDEVAAAEAILVLSCGTGVQAVAQSQEEMPVFPGLNSVFSSVTERKGHLYEGCALCGDCVIGEYAGICPVARCPKGQLHGPCGGYDDGKCEVDRDQSCVWTLILERAAKTGQLEKVLAKMGADETKNYEVAKSPQRVDFDPRRSGKLTKAR